VEILFYVSAGFICYTYLVYPLIICLLGTVLPKRVEKRYQALPLSVVLAVKNEEINVKTRIENLLSQDYEEDLIEIVVVSDASSDRTVELARAINDERVKVVESQEPVGKSGALNLGVEHASHDIIVFADARQKFGDNVFAELVAMFYDDKVGAVSGELVIERGIDSEVHEGVGLYWQYEKLIRHKESAVQSSVGATGSIYAIRKNLYKPLPEHTLLDDFVVPMRIVLQGYRVIYIRSAKAYDLSSSTAAQEFDRKVRTLAGNFQAVAIEKQLLVPWKNKIFFQFVSHKLARLLVPYFCVLALISSGLLAGGLFRLAFLLQIAFYAGGLLNLTPVGSSKAGALFRVSWTFMVLNAAAVKGLVVFLTGKDQKIWKKTVNISGDNTS
jgi:cellulose synthase/poly-beta-1,6-N-acetylglucosamine synthase-like glycosyltransferase